MTVNNDVNNDWLPGLMRVLGDHVYKNIDKSLPCQVSEISTDRTRVKVRPLIKIVDKNGNFISRNYEIAIPVVNFGAGGLLISFPIKEGDLGWIDASDRDISLFLQSYSESEPATRRKHSFNDARFIPDIMRNFTISPEDSDALVIQNRDGTVKIAIDDQIRITNSSVEILIDGNSVTGLAPGGFNLNGATINNDGNVITASGTSLDDHPHDVENVQPGSSTIQTTPPV